jgi:hypothetical protein
VALADPVNREPLDPAEIDVVIDELRALGWTITPPPVPPGATRVWVRDPPSWWREDDDGVRIVDRD